MGVPDARHGQLPGRAVRAVLTMTVTITKPATGPAQVVLAREALAELDVLRNASSRIQTAEAVARLERSVRQFLDLVESADVVVEYGVHSWSRRRTAVAMRSRLSFASINDEPTLSAARSW